VQPVAFVTGAAGGIGRAAVAALRARRMRVFGTDLALAEIPCGEPDFLTASLDVTDERAVLQSVARARAEFGRIDHVVHLAGRAGAGPVTAVSRADWDALLAVNLTSAFLLAKAAFEPLRASRGSLTLMSSSNGRNGGTILSGPAYAVAKAGIINLTRYLAREWAGDGIRVNCLAPGPIETPMVMDRFAPDVIEKLRSSVPLQRLGTAADVAHAIDYLTSERAGFVTGTVMNLSGGVVLD
jgi:3-oxoacyl-[acyl-carrier protein] reductase